jgi:malate dehydrogenase (oxaloacetate-decarboxylating)(NADP+)
LDQLSVCFPAQIQGTACITLAGILSALRANGQQLKDQKVLFYGAGEAGTGIGELITQALVKQAAREGKELTLEDARKHCFFMDSRGLVSATRSDAASGKMAAHKVGGHA